MIKLDGSHGEGGGAIIRNALALSLLTQKPFSIENIRKNRPKSGLSAQHLKCVHAAQQLSNAKVLWDELKSTELQFEPGKIQPQTLSIDIGTAGSITLLMQSMLPACVVAENKIRLKIKGGTDTKWSMPIDYLKNVLIPTLKNYAEFEFNQTKRGYYPKGGGFVDIIINPKFELSKTNPIEQIRQISPAIKLIEHGDIKQINGMSHASKQLEKANVAERCAKSAKKNLNFDCPIKISSEYCESLSIGSGITLWAKFESGAIVGADSLGERGKPAEIVGKQAAQNLLDQVKAPVDKYLADQLIIYLAMFKGSIKTSEITKHTTSNIHIVESFLGKMFKTKDNTITV